MSDPRDIAMRQIIGLDEVAAQASDRARGATDDIEADRLLMTSMMTRQLAFNLCMHMDSLAPRGHAEQIRTLELGERAERYKSAVLTRQQTEMLHSHNRQVIAGAARPLPVNTLRTDATSTTKPSAGSMIDDMIDNANWGRD